MRANAIPVILADNYVLPFSEKILWEEFSIFVRVYPLSQVLEGKKNLNLCIIQTGAAE